MLASKKELQSIEQENSNSVIMSDNLKELLQSFDDNDVDIFNDTTNFVYLFNSETLYKTKFVSYEENKSEFIFSLVCKAEALEIFHKKDIQKISIEYSSEIMIEKENLSALDFCFKINHIQNDNYLVEIKYSEV